MNIIFYRFVFKEFVSLLTSSHIYKYFLYLSYNSQFCSYSSKIPFKYIYLTIRTYNYYVYWFILSESTCLFVTTLCYPDILFITKLSEINYRRLLVDNINPKSNKEKMRENNSISSIWELYPQLAGFSTICNFMQMIETNKLININTIK